MDTETVIRHKFIALAPHLDERARRIWSATEAQAIGYGGISIVSRATGLSRELIARGIAQLRASQPLSAERIRAPGGGRKKITVRHPDLPQKLENLLEPLTRGDPESPLRWTCKSTRKLAAELSRQGIKVGRETVAAQLQKLGYSLRSNRKTIEGNQHPDRNAQFEHINLCVTREMKAGNPVISVDTKKKELVGNYKNSGKKYERKGAPELVNGHDFATPDVPRAYPYGVYDLAENRGFVNVGTDHDTASFAVASIQKWWFSEGRKFYPGATRLLITADSGGSNGARLRLWKWELQRLADELGLPIVVRHFPPGTSKWNKVEHRLFSFISKNWQGQPLRDYETVVSLITRTTTTTGLKVSCRLDRRSYPTGRKISDEEYSRINLHPAKFHGEWNYEIRQNK